MPMSRQPLRAPTMYICPHCNKPGISKLRRAFLGPAIPAACAQCGGKVGVPLGKTLVAALTGFVAYVVAQFAPTPALSISAFTVGAVVVVVLFFKFVPLVKK